MYRCGQVRRVARSAAPVVGRLFFNRPRSFEFFEGIETLEFQIAVIAKQFMHSEQAQWYQDPFIAALNP
jgi:hypothetical protein